MTTPFRLTDEAAVHAHLDILAEQGELPPDSLLLLLCGADATVTVAVAVDDLPPDPPQHERVRILAPFLRRLRDNVGAEGVLLVVARRGALQADGGDWAWHDAFAGGARTARLTSYGVYLATASGVRRLRPEAREVA